MRLAKLNLARYGKFTDLTLDFGEKPKDQPDLHVIYGPNEAGKTTLMEAYLDFLFGFPQKTKYNFKHANTTLKVGGTLTSEKETHTLQRLKKNKLSLIDANEQPTDDDFLLQQLSGLSRKSYESMFSLNDETLEEGGESILASEGDLGKLLYSATTGVAQLSDSLMQMRAETDAFYKKGKQKYELASLKSALKQIDSERKEIDIEANTYAKLIRTRDENDTKYNSLGAEHDQLKLQINKSRINKSAHPRLSSLQRLQAELLPLSTLPETNTDWIEQVKQLQIDTIKVDTIEQDFIQQIAALDKDINSIVLDEAALEANSQWLQVEKDRDQYLVANSQLTELHQRVRVTSNNIDGSLHKLGRTDTEEPKSLILNAATQSQLKDLITQQPITVSTLQVAKKEWDAANRQHTENLERFEQQNGHIAKTPESITVDYDSTAIEELELVIAAYSNNELTARFRTALALKETAMDDVNAIITTLKPWSGDSKALQELSPPHKSVLESLLSRRNNIENRLNDEKIALTSTKKQLSSLQSQQQSYTATGLVDDVESHRLRSERDAAWEKHKNTLDLNTAGVFEVAMRADDTSQASRLQHTESLAKLSQLARDVIITEQSVLATQANLDAIKDEQRQLQQELSNTVSSVSTQLDSTMSIEAFDAWIDTRTNALAAQQSLTGLERELATIDSQASKACADILKSLKRTGIKESESLSSNNNVDQLSNLLRTANATIKRERSLAGLKDQIGTSQHHLAARLVTLEKAQAANDQWAEDWQLACGDCWIGVNGTTPSTTIVEEMLQQLQHLEQQLVQQSELKEKIAGQESSIDAYDHSIISLAGVLGIAAESQSTDQLYQAIQTRISSAISTQSELKTAQEQHSQLLKQQEANHTQRSAIQASIENKTQHFSVSSLDEVQLKLQDITKKQELQQRINSEQSELLNLLEVKSLAEAIELLDGFDSDAAQLKLDELERSANDVEMQLREAHTAREDARRAVENVGGDDAVALLHEQRANLLLEIEEKMTRYLQQHLALNAADAALKAYRDNHRSSMMTKASDAFTRISAGRYSRLETFQDGGAEKLIAIEKNGDSKVSEALSKGTRFQLYLALRVAGYYEYANTRPTVPFIADDIMETSDDERATRTFEILGDMASVGQVIYLTHHQHLCDIAKRAVPDCKIHALPLS